jgi:hypothetical protein
LGVGSIVSVFVCDSWRRRRRANTNLLEEIVIDAPVNGRTEGGRRAWPHNVSRQDVRVVIILGAIITAAGMPAG